MHGTWNSALSASDWTFARRHWIHMQGGGAELLLDLVYEPSLGSETLLSSQNGVVGRCPWQGTQNIGN